MNSGNENVAIAINKILEDFNSRRALLGLTWQDLAERCHKDSSTLRKQLSRDSDARMSTLVEIAQALDGAELRLLTEEAITQNIEAYRERLADLQAERDQLRLEVDRLRELTTQQQNMIDAQAKRIERFDRETEDMRDQMKRRLRVMERMYESIEQKDEMISQLLKKSGAI